MPGKPASRVARSAAGIPFSEIAVHGRVREQLLHCDRRRVQGLANLAGQLVGDQSSSAVASNKRAGVFKHRCGRAGEGGLVEGANEGICAVGQHGSSYLVMR